ncbi:MAG: sulfotransferase [Flavobacteriaceae bacterium]|nr:sulfotransferase [Bacteroidia bacterium]MBT8286654.1 sulfotransferase [Bacteroidia bacterium]NNF75179.1 sulfotransferase [Flavobacteriaceae bacterium]NNK72448.1 sulfotransferase [Flavobacteriaceae bacterium]
MTKKVGFICVGVQKAGTSTLHDILKQHPDINLPDLKETHFFRDEDKFKLGLDHYFKFYFTDFTGTVSGEIDPEYSFFESCASRLKESFSELKVIFILRNPVDRAYSHYMMTRRRGLEDLTFNEAVKKESKRLIDNYSKIHFSYIARGQYLQQIERFEELFGKKNMRIYLFEDLVNETDKTIQDLTEFIGLCKYKYDFDIQSNPASEVRSKILRDFIYRPNRLKKSVGSIIPSKKLKDKIMIYLDQKNLKQEQTPPLESSTKAEVYTRFFKGMIPKLEQKLDRDLSSWKYKAEDS